jgi:DUF4097 and DUF4098 domain-containing protein YvlB
MDVSSGAVDIIGGENGLAEISGAISSLEKVDFSVTRETDGIHIVASYKGNSFWQTDSSTIHLDLRVPNGILIKVNTFDATINVRDYNGQVNITSVSGDIHVQNATGMFIIKPNRGNVTIETSRGEIHVLGNYGVLSVKDTRGNLNVSTIMGTIRFIGVVGAGDNLDFETDHGPVEIQLSQDSDAAIEAVTTSGVVDCTFPGLFYEGQGCAGTLHGGEGRLNIRTVSGSVTLQPIP